MVVLTINTFAFSQNEDTDDEGWKKSGLISFLANQSSFSNWLAGGENNFSGTLGLNYDFNYKKGNLTWDNKLTASYGFTKTDGSSFTKKTDDRLEINSIFGKNFKPQWRYTFFTNFKTQFTPGYEYSINASNEEIQTKNTQFFSPAYWQTGIGISWKKNDQLWVNLAPATARLIFVHESFTATLVQNTTYFGVEKGKTSRFEFGNTLAAYYKFELVKNVSLENMLNLYANYLNKPQNVDVDYTLNVVMKINDFLSANIAFQTIYDDNALPEIQMREVFGIGVNVGF